jgi:mannose-6-phosphate isomerase-like protein (cupin superfamily)
MADYTLKNLKEDVEDKAPQGGMAPNVEARFAREALDCEKSGVSYFKVAPNYRFPFGHKHEEQEELYMLASGSARLKLDDEVLDLKPWDVVRIGPGIMRGFEAGDDGAELIAFGAPDTGNADLEMVPEWWTD